VPLQVSPNPANLRYLRTKREKMGHLLAPPVLREETQEASDDHPR